MNPLLDTLQAFRRHLSKEVFSYSLGIFFRQDPLQQGWKRQISTISEAQWQVFWLREGNTIRDPRILKMKVATGDTKQVLKYVIHILGGIMEVMLSLKLST